MSESSQSHTKLFAFMILRELLARMSGGHKTALAFETVQAIGKTLDVEKISGDVGNDVEDSDKVGYPYGHFACTTKVLIRFDSIPPSFWNPLKLLW